MKRLPTQKPQRMLRQLRTSPGQTLEKLNSRSRYVARNCNDVRDKYSEQEGKWQCFFWQSSNDLKSLINQTFCNTLIIFTVIFQMGCTWPLLMTRSTRLAVIWRWWLASMKTALMEGALWAIPGRVSRATVLTCQMEKGTGQKHPWKSRGCYFGETTWKSQDCSCGKRTKYIYSSTVFNLGVLALYLSICILLYFLLQL